MSGEPGNIPFRTLAQVNLFLQSGELTVSDLKKVVADWPETDFDGEPTTVWILHDNHLSSPVRSVTSSHNGTMFLGRAIA